MNLLKSTTPPTEGRFTVLWKGPYGDIYSRIHKWESGVLYYYDLSGHIWHRWHLGLSSDGGRTLYIKLAVSEGINI